ncbi:SDR family oxidoreductase [Amycolatopsis jejuensis]|uniref:SDR family oxidoreductase n=1 Tax=Amycolatopsis jejuensis TaxID=330084 RepID=UPI000B2171F6|nr:NAD(P)H-binding protein [Amycolatopsis jejuensis]
MNTLTGEGLTGAEVLEFFRRSTGNLVEAALKAKVNHYVALSVVGADELPDSGYLRAKVAQEVLIRNSDLSYPIVRATQFLEFAAAIADTATVDSVVRLPGAGTQPIAAADVARAVAHAAEEPPANGIIEIGGPDVLPIDEWIRRVLTARDDSRKVVTDPTAKYFGTLLGADSLVPATQAPRGTVPLTEWLA